MPIKMNNNILITKKFSIPHTIGIAAIKPAHAFLELVRYRAKPVANKMDIEKDFFINF